MMLIEHVRFGIEHGAWALRRLLDHAESLPPERLGEDFGIGPGPLRENLAHTIEVMFFFADCFAGREYVEPADFRSAATTTAGLRALLARAHGALRDAMLGACDRGLPVTIAWPGTDVPEMPAAAAIAQVFDHAALHRTQAIHMLKRMGVRPVPELDPMSFCVAGGRWQE